MKRLKFKHAVLLALLIIAASIASLWSWNTLAELFNGPQAQYKHVLAAAVAVVVLRWTLLSPARHRRYHVN